MRCDAIVFIEACCYYVWERCCVASHALGASLFSLFQRNLPDLSSAPSLAPRKIRVGGVENLGNSCIFSAMLQDFAALPASHDALLSAPLQQGLQEPTARFVTRLAIQQRLSSCIQRIRSGLLVEYSEITALASELQNLGWKGHLSSAWSCFLYRLAPSLFSLPHFSVHELYEMTLSCLLEQVSTAPYRMVLTRKQDTRPFFEFFVSHREYSRATQPTLWRVAVDTPPAALEEQFQLGTCLFSLQVIHAYRDTPYGKHVVVYRRHEGEWISCNDADITQSAPSAQDTIYTMIYESHMV